ncbi:DUF4043 family protein [Methylobacterium sp. NEAU 140]|uniref:phage capsid family protein n=1 Tax=Methylobacterium sp. NEAU 140 TaxID=3064945 RepID=UPI002737633B|nr:DUF4043 family protein [Methylobacterium sp. NEAU 140]MDP4024490.1 DUF4043 family protein [Methylobacterium sp. NEAU 140]
MGSSPRPRSSRSRLRIPSRIRRASPRIRPDRSPIRIDWARHAILLNKKEMRKSAADQLASVRPLLTMWAGSKLRDDICRATATIYPAGTAPTPIGNVQGIPFMSATASQLNAWLTGNDDRVQFGNGQSTKVAGNFAASLANVDATNDLASVSAFNRVKRIAKQADPHIRPVRVDGGREYFVTFLPSPLFNEPQQPVVVTSERQERRPLPDLARRRRGDHRQARQVVEDRAAQAGVGAAQRRQRIGHSIYPWVRAPAGCPADAP